MQDVFLCKAELKSTTEEELTKSHSISKIKIEVRGLKGLGDSEDKDVYG